MFCHSVSLIIWVPLRVLIILSFHAPPSSLSFCVPSVTLITSAPSLVCQPWVLNIASQELLKIKYVEYYKYLKRPGASACTVLKKIFLIQYLLFACLYAGFPPSVRTSKPFQAFGSVKDSDNTLYSFFLLPCIIEAEEKGTKLTSSDIWTMVPSLAFAETEPPPLGCIKGLENHSSHRFTNHLIRKDQGPCWKSSS